MPESSRTDSELQVLRRMAANMVVWSVEMDNSLASGILTGTDKEQVEITSACVKTLLNEYRTLVRSTINERH